MTNASEKYPIAERFLSFQGEGVHMGRRAYFVRLFGCNVQCPWCDSQSAWKDAAAEFSDADTIAADALKSGAELVVITGGEPCMHNLTPLLRELRKLHIARHLETSGTLKITESASADFNWVALSPKFFAPPRADTLARADELKFIISDVSELNLCLNLSAAAYNAKALWLHPEWSKSTDTRLLGAIAKFVESHGGLWRAGWQLHKNFFVK